MDTVFWIYCSKDKNVARIEYFNNRGLLYFFLILSCCFFFRRTTNFLNYGGIKDSIFDFIKVIDKLDNSGLSEY